MAAEPSNLPRPGQTFLDHVGHFVPDAEDCAAALKAAGFTVTPFSAQLAPDPETGRPGLTGTGNVCVMLRSGYLEFLAHTADTPIGLEFKEALSRRAGLHLAAFAVADAEARHAQLCAAGFAMRPLVRMSRSIETPTGASEAKFTVARLEKGTMPEGRIQLLTHGNEAALWQRRWLDHANGADRLVSIVISAPDPAEAANRLSAFLDRPSMQADGSRYRVKLDRGGIDILDEAAAGQLVGTRIEPGRPTIVGYRVGVSDLSRTRDCMARAGLPVRMAQGEAIVSFPTALGLGAWVFAETPDEDEE